MAATKNDIIWKRINLKTDSEAGIQDLNTEQNISTNVKITHPSVHYVQKLIVVQIY